MPTRRKALGAVAQAAAGLALLPFASRRAASSVLVNDIHSQLNPTRVERIVAIDSEPTLRPALAAARAQGKPVCGITRCTTSRQPWPYLSFSSRGANAWHMKLSIAFSTASPSWRRSSFKKPLSMREPISVWCNKMRTLRRPLRRRVRRRRIRSAAVTGSLALLLIAGIMP
jgi:hypothetical protein